MITKMINKLLLNSKNIKRSGVFWNAYSATMNSMQTMFLLMVITRVGNMIDSGIFVIAYAIGNLMLNVGKFGVRQFQVTDINEKYSFKTYINARKVSATLMIVLSVAYVCYNTIFNSYTIQKSAVVLLICSTKLIEAYEDVYHGLMQQIGRLDVASKILGIRMTVFIVGCASLYLATKNLVITVVVNTVITLLLAIVLNRCALTGLGYKTNNKKSGTIRSLLIECFPLCACMCLNIYVANAPKYVIDSVVDSQIQTCFNIVFMPVFVIALLANFIFQPCLKPLGELWASGNIQKFIKRVLSLSVIVTIACCVISLVGAFIGAPILELIYKVDLNGYNTLLIMFMLSGGIVALQNLLIMAVTVVRYQKYMIYGYIFTAIILFLGGKPILASYGLTWLTGFFIVAMLLLLFYCALLLLIAIKQKKL